jgi:hypothetical protein
MEIVGIDFQSSQVQFKQILTVRFPDNRLEEPNAEPANIAKPLSNFKWVRLFSTAYPLQESQTCQSWLTFRRDANPTRAFPVIGRFLVRIQGGQVQIVLEFVKPTMHGIFLPLVGPAEIPDQPDNAEPDNT